MKRVRVLRDVKGEYAGEQVALGAGEYRANPVRAGHAVPGRNIEENPVVSYVLEDEGTRRAVQGVTAAALDELQRLGLVRVDE
jgi:hypothetical protein